MSVIIVVNSSKSALYLSTYDRVRSRNTAFGLAAPTFSKNSMFSPHIRA